MTASICPSVVSKKYVIRKEPQSKRRGREFGSERNASAGKKGKGRAALLGSEELPAISRNDAQDM